MSKVLIIAGFSSSLVRFRGELIQGWLEAGHEVLAVAPGCEAQEEITNMGADYRSINFNRAGINPLKDITLLVRLARLLQKEKPDYLFFYTIKPVIYGSLSAICMPRVKVFSMITGLGYIFTADDIKSRMLKKVVVILYRLAFRFNEKVFLQNRDDLNEMVKLKALDEEKTVLVNGSGVNTSLFYQRDLPKGPTCFLLVARLLREKGIYEYVEAARVIKAKHPQVKFLMIGWALEGDPTVVEADKLKEWKEEGIVEILGEQKDVRPYYNASSVYVLPSYREGTPRTVLEAMATGRAIITTDTPGCRETVIEGVNGFLVPVKNVKALAEAMEKFVLRPDLVEEMGKESRRLAVEKYDVRKVNQVINETMGLL